jgi:hypothetical protein
MKLKIKGNTYNVDKEFMKMYRKMSKKKKSKFDNLVKERADIVDELIFLHICSAQDIIDYAGKKK